MLRKTYAAVDLSKIAHNIRVLQRSMGAEERAMAVVKANAYGHGMKEIAKTAQKCGVCWFAVATADEAVALRESCDGNILLLSPADEDSDWALVKNGISVTAFTQEHLYALCKIAQELGMRARVHIKVDTGMGRIGLRTEQEMAHILDYFDAHRQQLKLEGLFTHFASADQPKEDFTALQLERYLRYRGLVLERGYRPICHASNSAAILGRSDARFDLCRMGISMYGYPPSLEMRPLAGELVPALSLKSKIMHVKTIEAGECVGYGRTYTAKKETEIATVAIGYADGYPRALSNRGSALFRGERVPIAGRVCMDQVMFDVTGLGAQVGEEITLMGECGGQSITADEIAEACGNGMISYEVLTGISARVPRVYMDEC